MNMNAQLYDPDSSSTWAWKRYKIDDIKIYNPSRMAKTPMERGDVNIDNKVIDPIEITVRGYVDADDTEQYLEFLDKWQAEKRWKFLRLISKFSIYDNLVLLNVESSEVADKFDVCVITCKLQQIMLDSTTKKSSDPANADTVNNGFVNGV